MTEETKTENLECLESCINEKVIEDDPYAYLERDFSSENFKIEVKNLPKYYGINVL